MYKRYYFSLQPVKQMMLMILICMDAKLFPQNRYLPIILRYFGFFNSQFFTVFAVLRIATSCQFFQLKQVTKIFAYFVSIKLFQWIDVSC